MSKGIVKGATRLFLHRCHDESLGAADSDGVLVLVELVLFINETFDDTARDGCGALCDLTDRII